MYNQDEIIYAEGTMHMKGNLILIHGGGPTAVINASLYGAITQAKR